MKQWVVNSIFFFALLPLFGQTVKVSVDKKAIVIGEPVIVTYEVTIPFDAHIHYEPHHDVIPVAVIVDQQGITSKTTTDLELLHPFKDTLLHRKSGNTWEGKYVVTCWDSGTVVIPEQQIIIDDTTLYFREVRFESSFTPPLLNQDIEDINEFYTDIATPWTWWVWMLIGVGGLAIVALVTWFIRRQYNRYDEAAHSKTPQSTLSLKDRTLLAIDALDKQRLWERQAFKEHYSELSFIMRSYLSARYNVNLLEKTTYEARLLLQQLDLHSETINTLVRILSHADMVKFAQSTPDELSVLKVSLLAKQVVAETSPIALEHAD